MTNKVEVIDSGDTTLLPGQIISKLDFREVNEKFFHKQIITDAGDASSLKVGQLINPRRLHAENSTLERQGLRPIEARESQPAIARTKLQGITQASLDTRSFISAASFQDTTRGAQ